jgi:hypothetical protein
MRELKEIAEDLLRTGLSQKQGKLLDELLEAATPPEASTTNAKPEGDDPDGSD